MNIFPQKVNSIFLIDVHKIRPNPQQPRQEFDDDRLADLAESIRQYGVLQPLIVTRKETITDYGTNVEYELIAGERRLRASKLAGLPQVPVIIQDAALDEKVKLELAIIENLQREDLNAVERARAFKKLVEDFKLKHHEIAARVGKSREYVTNTIRLLSLPEEMQQSLSAGKITEGHCRPLMMLSTRKEEQMKLYQDILAQKFNVRQAERISRRIAYEKARKADEIPDPKIRVIEEKLSNNWGTRVQIERVGGRGRISIDFFSEDELNGFLRKVLEAKKEEMAENSCLETLAASAGIIAPIAENVEISEENVQAVPAENLDIIEIENEVFPGAAEEIIPVFESAFAVAGEERKLAEQILEETLEEEMDGILEEDLKSQIDDTQGWLREKAAPF